MSTEKKQMEWGTRVGVILAVSGSAVGLGNFLRFPGQAAAHGGGAFMIPYVCALLLLALPIGWAEWAMARHGGTKGFHNGAAILGIAGQGRIARYFGVLSILIPMVVYMYYVYIEAWCLRYAWEYLTGGVQLSGSIGEQVKDAGTFFGNATGTSTDGVLNMSAVFWLIVVALNIVLVYRGLKGGIEKFCQFALPAMAILAVIVLVRVLTLGTPDPTHPDQNVLNGLGFLWNPDFSKLTDFETWLAAAGQIFFSLSVGFGVILNYASYLKKKDDVALSGMTASATNELFEVGFGGLITITAAFVFLGASGIVGTSTFGLGFQTLPVVFHQMGAMGPLDWIRLVLPPVSRRHHQLDLDATAGEDIFRGSARHHPRQSDRVDLGHLRPRFVLGHLVQQKHDGARHDGFLGRHLLHFPARDGADHLLWLDLGSGERDGGTGPGRADQNAADLSSSS